MRTFIQRWLADVEMNLREWLRMQGWFKAYFKKWRDEREVYMSVSFYLPSRGRRRPVYLHITPDVRKRWTLCNVMLGQAARRPPTSPEMEDLSSRIITEILNDEWWEKQGLDGGTPHETGY